jgi:hypothetical protein
MKGGKRAMIRSKLMAGVMALVLLGAIAGCGGSLEQPPETATTLDRTIEETIVVSGQPAEEANLDSEPPAEEANLFSIEGYVTVDAYHYDEATGTYVHFYHHEGSNVITTIGKDWIAQQLGGAPSANASKWISLSLNAGPPLVGWTQITAELNEGGLTRALGDYSHTGGSSNWTITETFTATAAHSSVQLTGLQWDSTPESNNNLLAANTFAAVDLAIDDSLTITWTLTLS